MNDTRPLNQSNSRPLADLQKLAALGRGTSLDATARVGETQIVTHEEIITTSEVRDLLSVAGCSSVDELIMRLVLYLGQPDFPT